MSEKSEIQPRALISSIPCWCRFDEAADITKLIENPRNPNKHPDKQIALLAKIIRHQGWRQPITVSNRSGFIVKGHGRLHAAKLLQVEQVPVEFQDYESEAAEYADLIADNRIAELAEPDEGMIGELLADTMFEDFDMDLTGFDSESLSGLISEKTEGLTDDDDVPAVPEEPTSRLGQIWKLGNHRLMCGNSTRAEDVERLMDGDKANMLHTDPPYGVDYEGVPNDHLKDEHLEAFLLDSLSCAFSVLHEGSNVYVWHADITALEFITAFRGAGFRQARPPTIQWIKPSLTMSHGDYHSQNEPCLFGWKEGPGRVRVADRKQTTLWKCDRTTENKVHPTMKPVELCQRAIENSSVQNCIVLDLFLGSGSTLIACEKTGRKCYGMELDPKYCDVIIKRWEDFTGKKAELING